MKWISAIITSLITAATVYFTFPFWAMTWIIISAPPAVMYFTLSLFEKSKSKDKTEKFRAELVSVYDGDTVKLDFHGRTESYRVLYIDAPEVGQPYAEESAAMLTSLLKEGMIEYKLPESSSYGRNVCKLYVGGVDVGLQMLKEGCAWIDVRYEVESEYIHAFADAKSARKGLFARKSAQHPSLYRKK